MARITKTSTGPVKSTLDSVVDKLQQMNEDQTALQKESITYANELQDYVQNEGHQLTNQQIITMQEMILALREGRLDDIEASREELVRQRAEDKRDEKRNDFLKDNLKQLKKQYKLLLKMFKEDKSTILGLIFRTAVVGLFIGMVQGFLSPYVTAIKKVGNTVKNIGKDFARVMRFPEIFAAMKQGITNLKTNIINFFKNTRLAQFFTGKGGILADVIKEVKMQFKDISQIIRNMFFNLKQVGRAFIGLFTGAPAAFAGLKDMKFAIDSNSKLFAMIGVGLNALKQPIINFGNKVKGFFVNVVNKLGGVLDDALKFFGGVDGTKFKNAGTRIRQFFSAQGPLSMFFSFFQKLQTIFIQLGRVIGSKLLFPIFGIIGGIQGFFEDTSKEMEKGERVIRGYVGFIRGAFRILIGEFLDFLKQALGFIIDLIPGVDGMRERFGEFSFADFFDNLYFAFADFLTHNINLIRDSLADISFGGLLKNMALSLVGVLARIADFPVAIAKGAIAALTTRFRAGPQERMEAFSQAYKEHMEGGMSGYIESLKTQIDGLDSEGNEIDYLSDEFNMLKRGTDNFGRGGLDLSSSSVTGGDTFNIGSGNMFDSNKATMMRAIMLTGGGGGILTGE